MKFLRILKNVKENLKDLVFEKIQMPFYSFVDFLKDLTKSKEDIKEFNTKVSNVLDKSSKNLEEYKKLMEEVRKISEEQKEIQQYIQSPQKGSLDSSYRKSLNSMMIQLDEEKIKKLEKILELGFDPILKLHKKDGYEEGPLSELIFLIKKDNQIYSKPKLTVINGGKSESSDN